LLTNTETQQIPGSLAVSFLQSLFDVVRNSPITQEALLEAAGLTLILTEDSCQRISGTEYCHFLDVAAAQCKDVDFGLHVGEAIKPGHYGVLGYACMSSRNFEEIVGRLQRYQYLVSDIGANTIQHEGDTIKFQFECKVSPFPPRQLAEEHLAGIVTFCHWISRADKTPIRVHFQHSKPDNIDEHKRIFACPVLFDQAETAIYFPAAYLTEALPQADSTVSKMMDSYAEEQLAKLPKGEGLLDQAEVALAELLQNGEPSLEGLASHLSINTRSLQRRLKESNLSYHGLLEKIRHQLALSYIQQKRLSLTDIAFLLGFAEQSSFQRAFKRWTGETPGRFRKKHQH